MGFVIHHKVGDRVEAGQPLFTVHANNAMRMSQAKQDVLAAHGWSETPVQPLPLFYN